jgi:DegV family protein with EDD domain
MTEQYIGISIPEGVYLDIKIIADSCCDLTPELRERFGATSIPLSILLGSRHLIDDETLEPVQFMADMKSCKEHIGSAAPSPDLYRDAFLGEHTSFVVTLSSNLSGSYESAVLGKTMAAEEGASDVHIFDSKSACAGETLIVMKLREFINSGLSKSQIINRAETFIKEMKTYFVLGSIDNLLKNGRLNKVVGKLISVLHIKPLMGSDGDGNIALYSHARSQNQIVQKLTDMIAKSGKNTEGESMVIAHCNNPTLAEQLFEAIKQRYHFKEVLVVPTCGLSSVYTYDQGIVIAF